MTRCQRQQWSLLAILLGAATVLTHAQTEMNDLGRMGYAAFLTSVVTDYQCVSINPANLGFSPSTDVFSASTPVSVGSERSRKSVALGFGQIGISARSDAMSKPQLLDLLYQRGSAVKFTPEDQIEAAREFADKGLRMNGDVLVFGASYQSQLYGGFAFTIRERVSGTFILNSQASEIIFQGRRAQYFDSAYTNWKGDTIGIARTPQRFSQLFNGTRLGMSWTREYAFSYGVPLYIDATTRLCMGLTGKYFQPYAFLEANAANGQFSGYSALSPWFEISYGNATTPSAMLGTALNPVGNGYGLDVGMTFTSRKVSVGVSVIDIGSISYTGNVYSAADTIVNGLGTTGFGSYNLFEEAPKITGEGNYFVWSGLASASTKLPTRMRLGASYALTSRFSVGFDMTAPLSSAATNPDNVFASAGFSFRPFPWLTLATGAGSGDGMDLFIPGSITFSMLGGLWEMGLSSIDISTLFTDRLPVVSANFGFLRFRL